MPIKSSCEARSQGREIAGLGPWLAELARPVILTLHPPGGPGAALGDGDDMLVRLTAAAALGPDWLDVDWRLAERAPHLRGRIGRVLSRHGQELPPDAAAARQSFEELRTAAMPGDRLKWVFHAEHAEEALDRCQALWSLPAGTGGQTGCGMGPGGMATRVLAWARHGAWWYNAPQPFDGMLGAAPGQFTLRASRIVAPARPEDVRGWQAVVGSDVAHSLSPWVQGAAHRAGETGIAYVPLVARDFARLRGAIEPLEPGGLAVTMPFKSAALTAARTGDADSRAAGACNTLRRAADGWHAFNTDVRAVAALLEERGAEAPPGPAWVHGAGGAARAAALALREHGREVRILARRREAAAALAKELGLPGSGDGAPPGILVNATPLGRGGRGIPFSPTALAARPLVIDALYAPAESPLVQSARMAGCPVAHGGDWFLAQAWLQYGILGGVGGPSARQAMEAALADGLPAAPTWPGRTIVLMGLRAAGKTTLGRALAGRLGLEFLDLDEELARRAGREHAGDVLAERGLAAFRDLEAVCLADLLGPDPARPRVLALGGGAVERPENRDRLARFGFCLWLDADPASLVARLAADPAPRPALTDSGSPLDEVLRLHDRRAGHFRELAHLGIGTDRAIDLESLASRVASLAAIHP
ncbi:MAG: shikimate kinase [Planctomycetota bacterium]